MVKRGRIRVTVNCVADHYADKGRERIVEFMDPKLGIGGLISFRRMDDGTLKIDAYRLDKKVTVSASYE